MVAASTDGFERYADWSRRRDAYEIDELTVALVAGLVVLAFLGWRRMADSLVESRLRAATEHELADTTQRYRSLFDYHPDAVFSLTPRGELFGANASAGRITGYSADELLGMHFAELVHPDDLPRVATAFARLLAREPQHFEARIRSRQGRLVDIAVTGLPIVVGEEVVGAYGIAEDVTERNRMQAELEEARRAAEQASEAKSLFLANMSHEIRTPLTTVLAGGELLSETVTGGPEAQLIQRMRRAGDRLLRLVDDILDFSRIEAGRTRLADEPYDLHRLLEDLVTPVRAAAEAKGLAFTWTLEPHRPTVLVGDAGRVGQVIGNLLDNAVKFTETGSVDLAVRTGDRLEIEVSDTGIGMSPEQAASVFESFQQADPSITRRYGGTGLGLAICRQLVEAMDGTIEVASRQGRGTTFDVRLPLRSCPQDAAARPDRR